MFEMLHGNWETNEHSAVLNTGNHHDEQSSKRTPLRRCLLPLLRTMKFWGLYFPTNDVSCGQNPLSSQTGDVDADITYNYNNRNTDVRCTAKRCKDPPTISRLYAIAVVAVLTCNAIRFWSAFTAKDEFGLVLISKVAFASIFVLCAILHFSYYVASAGGHLDRVIDRIFVPTDFAEHLQRVTLVSTTCCWVFYIADVTFVVFLMFFQDDRFDFLLAPFVVRIALSSHVSAIIAKVTFILIYAYVVQAWIFTQTTNLILGYSLWAQFRCLERQYDVIFDERGRLVGNTDAISSCRRRHQNLFDAVENVDQFLMFANVGDFCCHGITVVILLYTFCFTDYSNTFELGLYIVFFAANFAGLMATTVCGMMINSSVSMKEQMHRVYVEFCLFALLLLHQSYPHGSLSG